MDANETPSQSPAGPEPETAMAVAQTKRKRSTRNLILRGVSAIAALSLIYFCLRWDVTHASGWAWAGLIAVFSLLCIREFYRLAVDCELRPFSWLGYIAGPLWIVALEWDLSGGSEEYIVFSASSGVLYCAITLAMVLQLTRKTTDNALVNVAVTLLGIMYCCMLPGLGLHLRHMRLGPDGWPMHGVEFAVVCIFVAKVSDVGALLTGSRWGKHKLIPRLSPGKTWEGAIGGILFSILLLQFMVWTAPGMALAQLARWQLVVLSLLLAIGGLGGDLVESAFKRNSRRKDAGAGVPGFGGVLDLTDSLMIATPVMYFFLVFCGADYVR